MSPGVLVVASLIQLRRIPQVDFMKTVLIVDDWSGFGAGTNLISTQDAQAVVVKSVALGRPYFNGEICASILVIGGVDGAADFVCEVKKGHPRVHVIGFVDHRLALANKGCDFFVTRDGLSQALQAMVEKVLCE